MSRTDRLFHKILAYMGTFSEENKNYQEHYQLKKDHTFRVVDEVLSIGKQLKLNKNTLVLAETLALLHDIGRFEQYRQYQSFNDAKTENHAAMAVHIMEEQNWLVDYSQNEKTVIKESILLHNVRKLPGDLSNDIKLLTKMLRDADKIDILYVVLQNNIGHIMGLKSDDTDYEVPESIAGYFEQRKPVAIEYAQKLNDFRLIRASWIFDLNFKPSFIRFKERNYIPRILEKIPDSEKLDRIYNICIDYLEEKIS